MSQHDNNLDRALEKYLKDPVILRRKEAFGRNSKSLDKIFNNYAGKGDDADAIFDEELQRFFTDIGVPTSTKQSVLPLAVAWKLNCANPGEIVREEFVKGFANAQCGSINDIAALMRRTKESLKATREYREFYKWLFEFAKEQKERKVLLLAEATVFWNEVMPLLPTPWALAKDWAAFTAANEVKLKYINSDLWLNVYDFSQMIKDNISRHTEADAWHTSIDDFVAYLKAQRAKPSPTASGKAAAGDDDDDL